MMKFFQQFIIHPVGQGFFYSGLVQIGNNRDSTSVFRFVFDCGSLNKSACIKEVEEYRSLHFPENTSLDLLVISHFDADHVNHIKQLLDGRKVKKVIAPFLNFEERLFLALRLSEQSRLLTNGPDGDFTLRFIIDPVETIREYLDDDGEFIFIESDPNNPIFPAEKQNESSSNEFKEQPFCSIDFDGEVNIVSESDRRRLNLSKTENVKWILDSVMVSFKADYLPIMDFLFYQKSIGPNEKQFYDKVYELFVKKYIIHPGAPIRPHSQDVIKILKEFKNATPVKNLFREAAKLVPDLKVSNSSLFNMNTTALCMLHRNLSTIYKGLDEHGRRIYPHHFEVTRIQVLDIVNNVKVVQSLIMGHWGHHYYDEMPLEEFPNTMLTSDAFLLKIDDVSAFCKRYKNYWGKFWLFQVPHHGSHNNCDASLLAQVPYDTHNFLNYGAVKEWGGNWRHPSRDLISDIVATGHSQKLLPVNEFIGITFQLIL